MNSPVQCFRLQDKHACDVNRRHCAWNLNFPGCRPSSFKRQKDKTWYDVATDHFLFTSDERERFKDVDHNDEKTIIARVRQIVEDRTMKTSKRRQHDEKQQEDAREADNGKSKSESDGGDDAKDGDIDLEPLARLMM